MGSKLECDHDGDGDNDYDPLCLFVLMKKMTFDKTVSSEKAIVFFVFGRHGFARFGAKMGECAGCDQVIEMTHR